MTSEELTKTYPRLWHMAEDGSWPAIRENGLLSTSALLDLYGIEGAERHALESSRRPLSVSIGREGLPAAVIRDQMPMSDNALVKCLKDGLTPEEWYRILNDKVFFWLSRDRLDQLLNARAYRDHPQTILTVDTAGLVAAHADRILLSPINSGATIMKPQPRGLDTFRPIADYPFAEMKKKRGAAAAVVELVVGSGGVPDIAEYVLAVHRGLNGEYEELWRRDGTADDESLSL